MGDNNFSGVVDSLMKGLNTILSTKTVVGEATKIGDTIIVPLVDVSFGVGAGAKNADKKDSGLGAIGARMSPSAVLVIKNGSTKLVNIKNQDAVTKILDLVPDVVDKLSAGKKNMMDDDDAVDIAFPDKDDDEK
ncbi:MAG: GerW family sporulation protein [Butyrivibrio sp.]|nr:GerW family sporulation protein [Butyrivibrio sp.]